MAKCQYFQGQHPEGRFELTNELSHGRQALCAWGRGVPLNKRGAGRTHPGISFASLFGVVITWLAGSHQSSLPRASGHVH